MPKAMLCGSIWVTLIVSLAYVSLKEAMDPSFYWKDDMG